MAGEHCSPVVTGTPEEQVAAVTLEQSIALCLLAKSGSWHLFPPGAAALLEAQLELCPGMNTLQAKVPILPPCLFFILPLEGV